MPWGGGALAAVAPLVANAAVGVVAGGLVLLLVSAVSRFKGAPTKA
jgi:predicted DNA repair protein MutK